MTETLGPAEAVMSAEVARRYYLDEQSKVDIAAELGISRFKVARLLETARAAGLVRIEIINRFGLRSDLSGQLRQEYGLQHCVVVDAGDRDPGIRGIVGEAAARLLEEIVTERDVLGLPWSRTIASTVSALRHLPPVPVVQLTGSLALPDSGSPVDMVRAVSRGSGGPSHIFYAPFLLDDAAALQLLRRQRAVAAAMREVPKVTIAAAGVGAWAPGRSTIYELASPQERRRAADAGVVGEIMGILLDAQGNPVTTTLSDRLLTIGYAALSAIPQVIALVIGRERAEITRALVSSGLISALVTDAELGQALLG